MQIDETFTPNLFTDLQSPVLATANGTETPRFRDTHFLLNEKSLEHLDPSALKKYLEPLSAPSDSSSMKFTDDELFDMCQSRYIQQPSDVQEFAQYLSDSADKIKQSHKTKEERAKAWEDFKNEMKALKSTEQQIATE